MTSTVLIIDFGSQVTQLIARRVREAGVYCEIHPFQSAEAAFAKLREMGKGLFGPGGGGLDSGNIGAAIGGLLNGGQTGAGAAPGTPGT